MHAGHDMIKDAEEREYTIQPVMSELSTVLCDRALGLWIAGTRA